MKLISVNVSKPRDFKYRGKIITTGIFKEPVNGGVRLKKLNLEGDGQADLTVHGGEHLAVYVYPFEHYALWKKELGRDDFTYGQFGENFTVEGMMEKEVHIGDVFRVGTALLEVTQPRVPCYKLAAKMDMPQFPKLFMASGRTGLYLRVLKEGEVGAGDVIERVSTDPEMMSVHDVFHLAFSDRENSEGAQKALRVRALSPGWYSMFEERS